MSAHEILRLLLRYWWLTLTVFVLTGALAVSLFASAGAFTSRTVVSFTLPSAAALDTGGSSEAGVITLAAAVAREVDDPTLRPRYSDPDARAFGAGIRRGVLVGLPDSGGQWTVSYDRADIYIDVVGPTREWVARQQQDAIDRIRQVATAQQDAIGLAPSSRVTITVQPLTTDIEGIVPSRSLRILAGTALFTAALVVSVFAVIAADRRHARRARRYEPAASEPLLSGGAHDEHR
jgi:hypothetical protein